MHVEQPSNLGPVASVLLSLQQPCLDAKHPVSTGFLVVVVWPGLGLGVAFVGFVAMTVVVLIVVVGSGQPSLSLPSAADSSSGQHPKRVSLQSSLGHPFPCSPFAGVAPSGQQLNLVSLQVSSIVQPSLNGPVAAVWLSPQHPYLATRQAAGFLGRGLHFFGFCSILTALSKLTAVDDESSESVVDQMSTVVESKSDERVVSSLPVEEDSSVTLSSVDSVAPSVVLASLSPVTSLSVADSSVVPDDSVVPGSSVVSGSPVVSVSPEVDVASVPSSVPVASELVSCFEEDSAEVSVLTSVL